MRSRVWKSVLLDTMVGPIVLAQLAATAIGTLISMAAEPVNWLSSLAVNWIIMRSHSDMYPLFAEMPLSWSVIVFYLVQATLTTAFLYLLAVWLYQQPEGAVDR